MLRSIAFTLAAAGLVGCAQQPPVAANGMHGMMMGGMPMMGNMSPADQQKMMAACMEHMQAMGPGGAGQGRPRTP